MISIIIIIIIILVLVFSGDKEDQEVEKQKKEKNEEEGKDQKSMFEYFFYTSLSNATQKKRGGSVGSLSDQRSRHGNYKLIYCVSIFLSTEGR